MLSELMSLSIYTAFWRPRPNDVPMPFHHSLPRDKPHLMWMKVGSSPSEQSQSGFPSHHTGRQTHQGLFTQRDVGRRCSLRRGPSHLPAPGGAGSELEVISVSISVRVERDSKAKQKHLPLPTPTAPRCYHFPNFHQMGLVGAPQCCSSDTPPPWPETRVSSL